MKGLFFSKMLIIMIFISMYCSCQTKSKLDFTDGELSLLGNYGVNDTIFFESDKGDIDTILIVKYHEERDEGGGLLISTKPYHAISVRIQHLPKDIWSGSNWILRNKKEIEIKINYQSLIAISRSLESNHANYSIRYRGFVSMKNELAKAPQKMVLNDQVFSSCYKVNHRYPERVINPNEIEVVYWTSKYGLTAYSSKSGETWVIKSK